MNDPLHHQSNQPLTQALDQLAARWGWFVFLGVTLVFLGAVAISHVVAATLVSVLFVGVLMLAGGMVQLLHAWRTRGLKGFLFWTFSGIFYGAAGIFAILRPEVGASVLTLLFGATLIGTGSLRLWIWFNNRAQPGWMWLALSGVVTLLTGILVAISWPGSSAWVLGLILSVDLLVQGWTLLFLGLALRKRYQAGA